jgi:multidrug efflux pump subunit AcrB
VWLDDRCRPHARKKQDGRCLRNKSRAHGAARIEERASVFLRGQVTTMTSAYQQLYVGLAFALVLINLLIVVNFQSWVDPFVIA